METIETLLAKAERAGAPPEDPPQGIPKQKLPCWIRWPIRCLLLPILWIELWMDRLAKWIIKPPFERTGGCKRRGNCCHYLIFHEPKGVLKPLFRFYLQEIFGFYPRHTLETEQKKLVVMGCRYLKKNGACSRHFFRPKVCRTWPIVEMFGVPRLLKGCGFQIKVRKSYAKKHPELALFEERSENNDS